MPKPEQQVLNAIMDYLAVKHIWHRRMNSGAVVSEYKGKKRMFQFGSKGMADILCSVDQQHGGGEWCYTAFLWIEVKAPGGKQSPAQIEFMDEVREAGHYYLVAKSIDDVEKALEEIR